MDFKRRSRVEIRSEDEVYGEAIASTSIVPHVDGAGVMGVALEHGAAANIAINPLSECCPQ